MKSFRIANAHVLEIRHGWHSPVYVMDNTNASDDLAT